MSSISSVKKTRQAMKKKKRGKVRKHLVATKGSTPPFSLDPQ